MVLCTSRKLTNPANSIYREHSSIDHCFVLYAKKGGIKHLQKILKATIRFIYNLDIQTAITPST